MFTALVLFLLLLVVLLGVPLGLSFNIVRQDTFQSDVRLVWLFGLIRVQLSSSQPQSSAVDEEEILNKFSELEHSTPTKTKSLSALRHKAFRQRVLRFIRDLWHAIQKREVKLHLRVGLGDPADTGQLWSFIGPVSGILSNTQNVEISIEPEFSDTMFELNSSGTVRIIPLQLLYLILTLLLSPSIWRGFHQMKRGYR